MSSNAINWSAFFVFDNDVALLQAFARGNVTLRELALGVRSSNAKKQAYRIENDFGTKHGRVLARKALGRRELV